LSEPITKIAEYEMKTVSGEVWKVTLLGDKATNGQQYCEAHIKGKK
jgi:hypothetical protein